MVDTNPSGSVFSWERSRPLLVGCRAPLKREVLRLDAYGREFFVSQTPELTAMGDVVIDLARRHQVGGSSMAKLCSPTIGGTVPT